MPTYKTIWKYQCNNLQMDYGHKLEKNRLEDLDF